MTYQPSTGKTIAWEGLGMVTRGYTSRTIWILSASYLQDRGSSTGAQKSVVEISRPMIRIIRGRGGDLLPIFEGRTTSPLLSKAATGGC